MSLTLNYMFLLCSDLVTLFLLLYSQDEMSVSGSGTVVIRSPRGSQSSALLHDPSSLVGFLHSYLHINIKQINSVAFCVSAIDFIRFQCAVQSSSAYASLEDTSISGTVVFHGQHDDSDSPRTPRSRLGFQERTSSASVEDSAANLAEVVFIFHLY